MGAAAIRPHNRQIAVRSDIERYLTAHGKKDEHGGYGEYPVRDLKAAISGSAIPSLKSIWRMRQNEAESLSQLPDP